MYPPVNIVKFSKNNIFYRKPPVTAIMSTRKGKEEESVEQKEEKNSNEQRKNENISFNIHLQFPQKCKYNYINTKSHRFPLTFFFLFFFIFFDSWVLISCVFI